VNGGMADKGGIPRGGERDWIWVWKRRSRRDDSANRRSRGVKGRWNAVTSGFSYLSAATQDGKGGSLHP
jgi:hypothetical protein